MTQTMIMVGVLTICAVSGALLHHRSRSTPGPDEPTGSYTAPTPPLPGPPPVAAAASTSRPSPPPPAEITVTPPRPTQTPPAPVRRSRNNGFDRFKPAQDPSRARAHRG